MDWLTLVLLLFAGLWTCWLLWRNRLRPRVIILLIYLGAATTMLTSLIVYRTLRSKIPTPQISSSKPSQSKPSQPKPGAEVPEVPEIAKKDCQKLVDGQLLFEPPESMRQGQPYPIFARLSRNPGVNIIEGLVGSQFVIVTERVSCKVSMSLDSEEPNAFTIEKLPLGRNEEQFLEPDRFSQWDWRLTPRKYGTLHLLLYVTPMLYVDGIGEQLKQFRQPPKVITVTPDYLYQSGVFVKDNWVIISGLLTAVFIPLFLWFRIRVIDWFKNNRPQPAGILTYRAPRQNYTRWDHDFDCNDVCSRCGKSKFAAIYFGFTCKR